jgi:hypothetical protein
MKTALGRLTSPTFASTLLLVGFTACSSSSKNSDAVSAPDAAGADGAPASNDAGGDPDGIDIPTTVNDTATRGTTPTSISDTKSVRELFVEEDPTIDPTKTAAQNADAIVAQLESVLGGDGGGCAGAQITHATGSVVVSVVFGTGCTVSSLGLTVAGSTSASVSVGAGTVTVAFNFTNLSVNGRTIDGTASESTSNGSTYLSQVDVTDGSQKITFDGTEVPDSSEHGMTLSGTGTYQDGSATALDFTANGVHLTFGACYADAGTLSFQESVRNKRDAAVSVTETITFESATPTTGQAEVTVEGQTTTTTLPAYGSCPP